MVFVWYEPEKLAGRWVWARIFQLQLTSYNLKNTNSIWFVDSLHVRWARAATYQETGMRFLEGLDFLRP